MAQANSTGSGPHGHSNPLYRGYYKKGCRCEECVTANKEMCRRRYQRHEANDPERRRAKWQKHISQPHMLEAHRARGRKRSKLAHEKERCRNKAAAVRSERRKFLAAYRLGCGCADCGYKGHHAALEFDHVGDKVGAVMRMALWTTLAMPTILAEMEKCHVVCANCHRLRTKARDPGGRKRMAGRYQESPHKYVLHKRQVAAKTSAFLAQIKLDSGCADCGYREDSAAMDFDHVRGKKRFALSRASTMSRRSITAEIAKCEVVCANCHRVRTYRRLHPDG